MKTRSIKLLAFVAALGFVACDEDDPLGTGTATDIEARLGEYYLEAESEASNAYNIVDNALRDSTFIASDSSQVDGATVKRTGSNITIDFGNGVIGSDGITREGSIGVVETGDYTTTGGAVTATFNGYKKGGKTITGSLGATNNGTDSVTVTVTNFNVDNKFSFNTNKVLNWQSGFTTLTDLSDDHYLISGSSNGTETGTNNSFMSTVTTALDFDRACQYGIKSGVVDMTLSGDSVHFDKASVDFLSNDGCNNAATISLTNTATTTTITLTRQFDGF